MNCNQQHDGEVSKGTVNLCNTSQEEDPIFLARSYMMYKIGELVFFFTCLHMGILVIFSKAIEKLDWSIVKEI